MFEEYASMRADYERNWQVRRKPPRMGALQPTRPLGIPYPLFVEP